MRIDWSHVSKIYEPRKEIRGPYHRRTRHMGLLDFSASVRRGITAILGPEGSGKTTLLRLTATWMVPDDGRITYINHDGETYVWSKGSVITSGTSSLGNLKEQISYIPHTKKLDHDITVELSLLHLAQLRRVPNPKKRSAEMIAKWGLAAYRRTPLHQLAGGVLKRYLLAQSLIVSPKIWLLDEPTNGLDELGKRLLWQELKNNPADRITLIATDDMDLAECSDDLMLLEAGSCRRLGRKKLLTASVPEGTVAAWYRAMQAFSQLRSYQR
ncbi:ATP-binding cassette domain-containing protein [Lihuaxuella thermophila]|uniref:ABC-2 type transport system ATP-binding protein/oleandomycin transport system ATP-binding protein n=1 Tax=Lihuaxuella thermophila TaxID=1173111 RepID=A0A1H8C3F2_9BACL|nr:ATP-binding cassette domain-containing protein [Lihuaxuella thermophila]SEM89603.1 ABC-2 type transport system ATP-binding protein/oleandomycin transport system ATP-binding protein [Lihuaxuella thermophila]